MARIFLNHKCFVYSRTAFAIRWGEATFQASMWL